MEMNDDRVTQQAYGVDGMSEDLLMDTSTSDSTAMKLKKRPPRQSRPPPSQKDR